MNISDLIIYEIAPHIRLYAAETGPALTFGYALTDELNKIAVIVDAPENADKIFGEIFEKHHLSAAAILLTHTHWDHTLSAAAMKRRFNAPVYANKADEHRLIEPNAHTVWPLPFSIEPVQPDFYLGNKSKIVFGGFSFETLQTPGHTEGGVCFLENNLGILFTGDTLFSESVGRADLPGGNFDQLIASIKSEIMTLRDDIKIYPGHGDPTDIGTERLSNPFLR